MRSCPASFSRGEGKPVMVTWQRRGKRRCSAIRSSPSRARAAGRVAVMRRSALASNSSSELRSAGNFRSSLTTSCPAAISRYHWGWYSSMGSPPGGSTLTTVPPMRESRWAAAGPGRFSARLTIRIPSSGFMVSLPYARSSLEMTTRCTSLVPS